MTTRLEKIQILPQRWPSDSNGQFLCKRLDGNNSHYATATSELVFFVSITSMWCHRVDINKKLICFTAFLSKLIGIGNINV